MQFDSNLAWKQATGAILANREVVLALAGVFFLLPGLVTALLFPAPAPVGTMDRDAALAAMSDYYVSILPYLVPMVLFQAAGTLALLTMLTDRTRPTVGEAIGMGLRGIVPYMLAQIALGVAAGLIGGVVLAIGAASGVAALALVGLALVVAAMIYAAVRTALVAPVIAVEGERGPIAALKRSWALTRGNVARLLVFFALIMLAFTVVSIVASSLLGSVAALIGGAQAGELTGAVISAVINAAMALCLVAGTAAAHRQLAGPSAQAIGTTFD
jgi:Membrane domain of glycerophosphoryl diester phosphodiesterase